MRSLVPWVASSLLIGCSQAQPPRSATLIPNAVADNLYVSHEMPAASLLNIGSGKFDLSGRCLVVDTGDGIFTPVFIRQAKDVTVTRNGVFIANEQFAFGQLYEFPGLAPPSRIDSKGNCPKSAVYIGAIQPSGPNQRPSPPNPQPTED